MKIRGIVIVSSYKLSLLEDQGFETVLSRKKNFHLFLFGSSIFHFLVSSSQLFALHCFAVIQNSICVQNVFFSKSSMNTFLRILPIVCWDQHRCWFFNVSVIAGRKWKIDKKSCSNVYFSISVSFFFATFAQSRTFLAFSFFFITVFMGSIFLKLGAGTTAWFLFYLPFFIEDQNLAWVCHFDFSFHSLKM